MSGDFFHSQSFEGVHKILYQRTELDFNNESYMTSEIDYVLTVGRP